MPIKVGTNAVTGGKTVTSGTSFTIALNSTAGDQIIVGIAQSVNTLTVSSITDTGGNTYHKVGGPTTNTGVVVELWKTDAVNPAASGTITVNVSTTGGRAVGVAIAYHGVAYSGNAPGTATGSTSPLTTGSLSLKETNSWVVTMFGLAANNNFVAQNGSLRGQLGTTSLHGGLVDSNDNASPIIDSVTTTASTWAAVSLEMRLLEPTQLDTMTMSDALTSSVGAALALADVMETTDGDTGGVLTGKENIDWNRFAHWNEGFIQNFSGTLRMSLSDGVQYAKVTGVSATGVTATTEVWNDGVPTQGIEYQIAIACPHLNNWADTDLIGYGNLIADSLTLSDSMNVGYGFVITDTMTLTDSLLAGYGTLFSDQLVIVDSMSAGYGALLSDNLNSWADPAFTINMQYRLIINQSLNNWLDAATVINQGGGAANITLTLSDSLNNWLDSMLAGYGAATSDQIIFVDSMNAGYGAGLSDTMTLSDSDRNVLSFEEKLSDSLNFWADQLAALLSIALTLSDSLNNWADALLIGYGNAISDQMTLSDALAAGYGSLFSDQIILVDSLGAGYGAVLSDNLNNWLDLAVVNIGFAVALSDNLNNWSDSLLIGYGNAVSDTMTMSDQLFAGYGNLFSDQLVIVDSLGAGYGLLLSDNLNNWLDLFQLFLQGTLIQLSLSDTLTMLDSLLAGYGSLMSDQLVLLDSNSIGYGALLSDNLNNWADSSTRLLSFQLALSDNLNSWAELVILGYGNALSDQLVLVDSLGAGYGLLLSDNLNNWQDFFQLFLQGTLIQLSLSDTLTMLDSLLAGYGSLMSDQLILLDSSSLGYGAILSDNLNNWLDSATRNMSFEETLSDNLSNWADSKLIGYGNAVSDQMSQSDSMLAGYGNAFSDQLVIVDSLSSGYGAQLSDNLNNWADLFAGLLSIALLLSDNLSNWADSKLIGYGNLVADQLTMADSTLAGYGSVFSDQLIIADSLGAGYGALLSDTLNNWLDAVNFASVTTLALSDTLNNWSDLLNIGYGATFADQFTIADALRTGYGNVFSDTLSMQDSLGLGYGLFISESVTTWLDLFVPSGLLAPLQIIASDTMSFWLDSIQEFMATNTGPAKRRAIKTYAKIQNTTSLVAQRIDVRGVNVNQSVRVNTVDATPSVICRGVSVEAHLVINPQPAAALGLELVDDASSTWLDSTGMFSAWFLMCSDTLNLWSDSNTVSREINNQFVFSFTDDLSQNWNDLLVGSIQ